VVTGGKELLTQIVLLVMLDAKATGPALRGIAQKHDKEWLYKWIHNPAAMISQAMLQR
jgi:hypothetical protein